MTYRDRLYLSRWMYRIGREFTCAMYDHRLSYIIKVAIYLDTYRYTYFKIWQLEHMQNASVGTMGSHLSRKRR